MEENNIGTCRRSPGLFCQDCNAAGLSRRGFKMIHGLGKYIENALSGIQRPVSDSRALAKGFFPFPGRAHPAEPEGISSALERPDRVNPAALIKKSATAVGFLGNAESRCNGPQIQPGKIGYGNFKKTGQNPDLRPSDPDDARIARAAGPAAPAFKTNSGVKKIPAMIVIVRVAFHMGFDL